MKIQFLLLQLYRLGGGAAANEVRRQAVWGVAHQCESLIVYFILLAPSSTRRIRPANHKRRRLLHFRQRLVFNAFESDYV